MMKVLKSLYIIWVVFGTILSLYGFFYMIFSDKSFLESFSLAILILLIFSILPLLPYFYYLIYNKARKTKNIFVVICCYLLLFVVICCYLLLLLIDRNNVNFQRYLIIVTIHIIIFTTIYLIKRNKNENPNP
ncbi:hypothetical protein [Campylobacter helveticus]|uniref:hypothetical protein n=1 Tax=Campylobacter helveticus TaxID=28898 RepID=UPI0014867FE1|nr:hypothetical protein [Campylobacter helveticus]